MLYFIIIYKFHHKMKSPLDYVDDTNKQTVKLHMDISSQDGTKIQ